MGEKKVLKLIVSIILDILGYASYFVPFLGELSDLIFGPIQAVWIKLAYDDNKMAIIGGLEEIIPYTDFIPSCLIAHWLHYRRKNEKRPDKKTK